MVPAPTNLRWDAEKIRRAAALADLYNNWPGEGDPDDDPDYVRQAREIMGEPPLPSAL
jgi:hypothetical protein